MMGKSHAKQGLCALGITGALAALIGYTPLSEPLLVLTSAGLVIGGAITPDMDAKGATASLAYGPITQVISAIIRGLARLVYEVSRDRRDPKGKGAHRLLTHTLLGNILAGVLMWLVCSFGSIPSALMVGGVAGIGAFCLLKKVYLPIAAVVGFAAYSLGPEYAWIWGIVFALGNMVHCFGDSCTVSGTPYFWPISRNGRRWGNFHVLPENMRIITGKRGEPIIMGVTYAFTFLVVAGLIMIKVVLIG
jgi:membrane-bound metal-dependent hydrolase YbcI (DUF457 family)